MAGLSKCPPMLQRRWAEIGERSDVMRKLLLAAIFAGAIGVSAAQADTVGAVAGAGTGLLVAGPPGAVVGGVVGAVWGKPFWGPSISKTHCWTDNDFHRHCSHAKNW
jgi:hypothetical protein